MSDPLRTPRPAPGIAGLLGLAGVLLIGAVAFLQPLPGVGRGDSARAARTRPATGTPAAPAAGLPAADSGTPCTLHPDGFLRGRFFGALSLSADWSGTELLCGGMLRPGGGGVRLFFAGQLPEGGRLAVLLGIDGPPDALVGTERSVNVTVIDERAGQFFSSGGAGRCWARVSDVTALPGAAATPVGQRISGLVWCVGALPSLRDRSSITLGDLQFAGRIATDDV